MSGFVALAAAVVVSAVLAHRLGLALYRSAADAPAAVPEIDNQQPRKDEA